MSHDDSQAHTVYVAADVAAPRALASRTRGRSALPRPTLHGLFAYREVGKAHVDRTFLRVEGQGGKESFFAETEAADARGITSQLMRHNEVAARIALGQTSEIIEYYKRALEACDRRIDELEQRQFKMLELYEKLQWMQHERDLEVVREQRGDERTKFLKRSSTCSPADITSAIDASVPSDARVIETIAPHQALPYKRFPAPLPFVARIE